LIAKNDDIPALFEKLNAIPQDLVNTKQCSFDEGAHRITLLDLFGK